MTRWTQETIDTAVAAFHRGDSFGMIGKLLGTSRSAVGAKLIRMGYKRTHELGCQLRSQRIKRSPKPPVQPKEPKPRKAKVNPPKPVREADDITPPRVIVRPKAWEPLEGTTPQAEWQPNHCKWPIGSWEEGDRFFCCAPAKWREDGTRSPYCSGHHAIGFDQTDTRAKRARSFKGALWAARVAAQHGLQPDDLTGQARFAPLVKARQEAMYRLSKETRLSSSQIGKALGGRDHTTVLYGIARHAERIAA